MKDTYDEKIKKIELDIKEQEDLIRNKENKIDKTTEIEIIYHLGDIHIPGNIDREKEYEKVLQRTIKTISQDSRKKMTVICGDLFHDKTKPYQEANILARDFMKDLGDISETIIIQGNHDINIDNENRKDSIKSTLRKLETNFPIHYLTENKIYKINGINFGLTKMTDNKVTEIGIKNVLEMYIGLYHGTLYKSKTDEGYEFNDNSKIKASNFHDYDIVMLGDIHKHQYMNKEKTIAYSGSLIQQNFGESINSHGILMWNMKTKESNLIEIENDYIYKTHIITDIKNFNIPDIENKLCRLKLLYKGYDRLDLIKYEKEIKSKYNILQLVKHEITEDIKMDKNMKEEDIMNKKFMNIYMEFLEKNKLTENIKVSEMLEKIIDEEQKKVSKEKKEIKIHELEFENLLAYGSGNKINFNKLNGINILAGTNGLGKSSLIDIILFTIYNECSKGEGKDVLNIRHNKGYSILRLELNGEKYTIYRGINMEKTKVCLLKDFPNKEMIYDELKKIENEKKEKYKQKKKDVNKEENNIEDEKKEKNISDDGKTNIDKQIIELFGEYEDMIMTSVILQTGKNFIDLDNKLQRTLLTNILGLKLFINVRTYAEKRHRDYTTNILKKIEKEMTHINYEELIKNKNEELINNEEQLKKNNQEYLEILKEKHILEYKLDGNSKININNINQEKNILIIKQNNLEEQLKLIKQNINFNDNNYENTKEKLENEIDQIQIIINKFTKEIKKSNNNNIEKLKKDKHQHEKIICEIKDSLNTFNKYIEKLNNENKNILDKILINL